jgi:trehalose synthase
MWKSKPVIGGNTGGIRLQVVNDHTGLLVHTPGGAALRIRYLLQQDEMRAQIGEQAKRTISY